MSGLELSFRMNNPGETGSFPYRKVTRQNVKRLCTFPYSFEKWDKGCASTFGDGSDGPGPKHPSPMATAEHPDTGAFEPGRAVMP